MNSFLLLTLLPFSFLTLLWPAQTTPSPARPTPTQTAPGPAKVVAPPVVWSATRPLTADDFKARAPFTPQATLTVADIKASAGCKDYVFAGGVQATFDPNTSWIRDLKKLTPTLLRHEQLHFDITELYARRLRQKISLTKFDCLKLQPTFDNLTKPVYRAWATEENRYDGETNHGLNAAKQTLWEQQIKEKLAALQAFAE